MEALALVPPELLLGLLWREAGVLGTFLVVRLLPFALAAVVTRDLPAAARAVVLVLFAGSAAWAVLAAGWSSLVLAAVAVAYLGLAACVVHGMDGWSFAGARRAGALASSVFLFVLAPAWLVPAPLGVPVAVTGWDLAFAAYGYLRRGAPGGSGTLGDCLRFLLVNPVLLYSDRGRPVIPAPVPAVRRIAAGLAAVLAHHVAHAAMVAASLLWAVSSPLAGSDVLDWRRSVPFAAYHAVNVLAVYAAASGRASIEVGLMSCLGLRIPERYDRPLAARSPADFWRRWNAYLGRWARVHAFVPLARGLRARCPRLPLAVVYALAVLATFAAIGAAHDLMLALAGRAEGHGAATVAFVVLGALAVAWPDRRRRRQARPAGRLAAAIRVAGRGARALAIVAIAAAVLDVLAGAPIAVPG